MAYQQGLNTRTVAPFDQAARLWPLTRSRRSAGAYARMLLPGNDPRDAIRAARWALQHDPNAADLWLDIVQMDLNLDDRQAYTADMVQLKRLTPHIVYTEVVEPRDLP